MIYEFMNFYVNISFSDFYYDLNKYNTLNFLHSKASSTVNDDVTN